MKKKSKPTGKESTIQINARVKGIAAEHIWREELLTRVRRIDAQTFDDSLILKEMYSEILKLRRPDVDMYNAVMFRLHTVDSSQRKIEKDIAKITASLKRLESKARKR